MTTQQQKQLPGKPPKHKRSFWVRLIIAIIALILIIIVSIFSIQGSIILTILSVAVGLFQWLLPIASGTHEPHILVSHESIRQPSALSEKVVSAEVLIHPLSADLKLKPQEDKPVPKDKVSQTEAIRGLSNSAFLFNEALTDSKEFYGRVREWTTLLSRTHKGLSTSIVGPRRIGKTWLISYLRLIAPSAVMLGTNYRIGYLDATRPSCATVAKFTTKALEELGINILDCSNIGLDKLEQAVESLKSKNLIPILCIDEFEGFSNRSEFDLNFFSSLRAIAQEGLGLVVASKSPLIDIVDEHIKTSPFFNVFEQLTLKPFDGKEAGIFVQSKGDQADFTEQERAYLLKYGQQGKQQWTPIRLQLVGKMLLNDKITHYYRPDDPNYWEEFEIRLEETYRGVVR